MSLSLRKNLQIKCNHCPTTKITTLTWTPPYHRWIKANTDGMASTSSHIATIGGVFRTYKGFLKRVVCQNRGNHITFYAELYAFIQAIQIAYEKNWKNLWVELDSKPVVQCIQNHIYKPPGGLLTNGRSANFNYPP